MDLGRLQSHHSLLQIDVPNVRHAKHTSSAGANSLGIEDAGGFGAGQAPCCAERLGNAKNRSNVPRILQACENDDEGVVCVEDLRQVVLTKPDKSDHTL